METTATATPKIGKDFLLAGRAIFTVANPTGDRYTFKVTRKDPQEGSRYTKPTYFVALLTGSDNENDYTYMGLLSVNEAGTWAEVKLTKASRYKADSTPVKVANWVMVQMMRGLSLPDGYFLGHEGKCGRCGRTLTVPSSLITGLGPDCAAKMGLGPVAPAQPVLDISNFEAEDSVDRAERALGVE